MFVSGAEGYLNINEIEQMQSKPIQNTYMNIYI